MSGGGVKSLCKIDVKYVWNPYKIHVELCARKNRRRANSVKVGSRFRGRFYSDSTVFWQRIYRVFYNGLYRACVFFGGEISFERFT